MVLGSSPVAVTSSSDFASSKEFLDIQATIECGFTLKRVRDMTRTYSHFNDHKAFIEYSNDMHGVYKNIDEYNPYKENKLLIVFDDMIADMVHNKKLNSIIIELFIRGIKLNISLVFITQSYFKVSKYVRLNNSHFFIAKIPNKRELQQIAINHSSDINTKDVANIYRKCKAEPYSFLVNDTILASDNTLRFRKILFNIYNKNHDN